MLSVKKDYESIRNIAFTVYNSEKKKKHSVLFKKDKKIWCCDCTWNSLKGTPCSHIKTVIKKMKEKKAKELVKKLGV